MSLPSFRTQAQQFLVHSINCSVACGIFPAQGSNPHVLDWQAYSLSFSHQGDLKEFFLKRFYIGEKKIQNKNLEMGDLNYSQKTSEKNFFPALLRCQTSGFERERAPQLSDFIFSCPWDALLCMFQISDDCSLLDIY